ncbi:MAG: hypothetical protein NZ903_02195 [Candidatus Micrarchaeota archaeon]|nr:hypothetical protein [Candidatus Micrarchaeota archaeon]
MKAQNKEEDFENTLEYKIANFKKEANEEIAALEKEIAKLRDPTVHSALMYLSVREKENTNRLLKSIYARLDQLEEKLRQIEQKLSSVGPVPSSTAPALLLSSIDQKIIEYIREHGPSSAETIQKVFSYKGRNAASARLNKLATFGHLVKQRAGKTIYYACPDNQSEANLR